MKRFLTTTILITILTTINIYSQQNFELKGSNIFLSNIGSDKDVKIKGTKYLDENYSYATIDNGTKEFLLRFDIIKNEFEYKLSSTEIIRLNKIYNTIKFKNYTFKKINYTENETKSNLEEYLVLVENSNEKLFKKIGKKYNAAIESASSYESAKPANYSDLKPKYIIKFKDSYIELPKKNKEIDKMFPEKFEELKVFIKSNKIKLDKEEDLIKLVNFLNK